MTNDRSTGAQANAQANGKVPAPLVESGGSVRRANRRRVHRVAWEHHDVAAVSLEVQEPGDDWRPVECTVVDLGAGGMGLLVEEPLAPGSRVRVTLDLPQRLGREVLPEEDAALALAPWTGHGEVVHTRHTPEKVHDHVPPRAHLPHHHGVRFRDLANSAELQLMNALYGPLPAGWAVERYLTTGAAGKPGNPPAERYAVLKDGRRLARGFATYDRARSRAWSLHMDEMALARRRPALVREGASA